MATKYTRKIVEDAVKNSKSYLETLRNLNVNGGLSSASYGHLRRKIIEFEIDTSHFTKHSLAQERGKNFNAKLSPDEALVILTRNYRARPSQLRRALVESGVPYKCSKCENGSKWQGEPIILQVDHIDGNWRDCRKHNLQFLCPNCHSQKGHTKLNVCKCGEVIPKRSKLCNSCFGKERYASEKGTGPYAEKGNWPDTKELADLVWNNPVSLVASKIGVSDSIVKKRCKRLGISTHPRGYWNKVKANKIIPV